MIKRLEKILSYDLRLSEEIKVNCKMRASPETPARNKASLNEDQEITY